jgi:ABC-type lipoprotein export system ATPase subunit
MISTKDITFSYQKDKLFHFPDVLCFAGETLLVTGNSGTGKTTFLHILAGILEPLTGEIEIDKQNILSLNNSKKDTFRGKNIGIVFQKANFISALSIVENLEMASWLATGKKNTAKAKELLAKLNIADQAQKMPSQLSIGQQQRANIARALITEPKVILADEPTSSLDDKNAKIVVDLLVQLSKEYKAALLIVTHDNRIKTQFTNQITMI